MLEVNGDKDETLSPVTNRMREVLARNITARNHGLSPLQFNEAVSTLLSSLVAARLLEEAGCIRYGSVEEETLNKGLAKGLSFLFENSTQGDEGGIPPGLNGTDTGTWPFVSACTTISIDPAVTSRLLSLTREKKFFDEWADAWSDSHERSMFAFLNYSAHLSHDGRMVIGEQYPCHAGPGVPLIPAGLLQKIAGDLLLPRLAGKTPKNAGIKVVDPACRTGRILLAMYQVLAGWHLSWYTKHLVPLLAEGRDPASRKVQGLLPPVVSTANRAGYQRCGTLPLPVYQLPGGRWDLTRDEKVRIIGESLYGIDSDRASIEVTRLSLLSYLLHTTGDDGSGSTSPGLLPGIVSRNIRCGNILIGKDYEEQPSLSHEPGEKHSAPGIFIGDEFPAVASGGGFGVVCSMFPSLLPFSGKSLQDYLCRHYQSGKPDDATPYYLESGLLLTRPGGVLCGVVTGGWQRSRGAAHFRGWLAGYQVERVISLGNLQSFAGMSDPVLITITNHPPEHPVSVTDAVEPGIEGPGSISFRTTRSIDPTSLGSSPWMFKGVPPAEVRKKIDSAGTPLARYILGEYMLGEQDNTRGFIISRQEYDTILRKDPVMGTFIHPYSTPGEVRRYSPPVYSWYIVRIPPGTTRALAGDVPDLREWFRHHHHTLSVTLTKHRPKTAKTRPGDGCWWEWPGPATLLFMKGPLLLTRASGVSGGPEWMISSRGVYPGTGVIAIRCNDPALPGILNSHLATFYILSSARKKGMPGYLLPHIMKFPLPVPDAEDASDTRLFRTIAHLVEKRCALSKAGEAVTSGEEVTATSERVRGCDEEIDTLVYELYGLSDGEAGSIEEWLSREDVPVIIREPS
ncbi:MAG: hypothetical protein WCJ93_02955 [Methanomicrobiales archaeon]